MKIVDVLGPPPLRNHAIMLQISSISRIVTRVTAAISRLAHRHTFSEELTRNIATAQAFCDITDMSNMTGAIDGTLITTLRPKGREHFVR